MCLSDEVTIVKVDCQIAVIVRARERKIVSAQVRSAFAASFLARARAHIDRMMRLADDDRCSALFLSSQLACRCFDAQFLHFADCERVRLVFSRILMLIPADATAILLTTHEQIHRQQLKAHRLTASRSPACAP